MKSWRILSIRVMSYQPTITMIQPTLHTVDQVLTLSLHLTLFYMALGVTIEPRCVGRMHSYLLNPSTNHQTAAPHRAVPKAI